MTHARRTKKPGKWKRFGLLALKGVALVFQLQTLGVIQIKEIKDGAKGRVGVQVLEVQLGRDIDGDGRIGPG